MSDSSPSTPKNLFARIELLKQWQLEQQQRLYEQQAKQNEFLSNEQKRMQEAFASPISCCIKSVSKSNNENSQDLHHESETEKGNTSHDEIIISTPVTDFNALLEEKLNEENVIVDTPQNVKPKRAFLKKGTGLSRFRMTAKDFVPNKPQAKNSLKLTTKKTNNKTSTKTTNSKSTVTNKDANLNSKTSEEKLIKENSIKSFNETAFQSSSSNCLPETTSNYQTILAELLEMRNRDPSIFSSNNNSPAAKNSETNLERELFDELKIFETLEQKVLNSSFCSTSSIVTRLFEQSGKPSPRKMLNFHYAKMISDQNSDAEILESPIPKRTVSFATHESIIESDEADEQEMTVITEENDDESQYSDSSLDSNDITDGRHFQTVQVCDAATNTDQAMITNELLKTRLEQLEVEIETFRSENARLNQLKSQFETDSRNLDKRKRQLEKDIEEQRKQIAGQLNEERSKLARERTVYDRYAREAKDGKTLRQKEREEVNVLRSKVNSLSEEMKLKESKWGATQARLRNQLRHLEKENATLRTENNDLGMKNAKLEATNKQLLTRRPTDTKVLHEINKNLTKLTQNTNGKSDSSDTVSPEGKERKINKKSSVTRKRAQPSPKPIETSNKENSPESSLNTTRTSHSSYSEDHEYEPSFDRIEREYERVFGKLSPTIPTHTFTPANETLDSTASTSQKQQTILDDGSTYITYPNGNIKTISADSDLIIMQYHNGDVKETNRTNGVVKYLYSDAKTTHITYPDGIEILEFPSGQVEKRFADGTCEILFPNGCRKCTAADGTEEITFPDGTSVITMSDGQKVLTLPNGQKEVHTKDHKRREYPDGTIKLLYPDGVQETRYANGRIRLKDKDGNLIMDSAAE